MIGYRGDGLTGGTGVDPQTVVAPGVLVVDVNANQANPNTFTTGGVTEFEITNPVVALAGSGTAGAPSLNIFLNTTGVTNITVMYNLRDIDGSTDNAVQPVALQYRIGNTGNFTNIPAAFVADASTGPGIATLVTPVNVTLPTACDNQAQVELRMITTNAVGNDEWIGVDDIQISGTGSGLAASITASTNLHELPDTDGSFTVSLSSAPGSNIDVNYTVSGTATSGSDFTALSGVATVPSGNTSVVIPVDALDDAVSEGIETIIITLQSGTGYNVGSPASVTLTISEDEKRSISLIQTSGTAAIPGTYVIEGIVTGTFPLWSPGGFYVQEEDADADGDPLTSDAIYVVSATPVNIGDRVLITGTVQENGASPSFNQAVINPASVTVQNSGNPLPTVTDINLPVTATADFERYEGMIVRFPYALMVSGNTDLGRFGELRLSRNGLVYQPTQIVDPNDDPAGGTSSIGGTNVPAVTTYANNNIFRTVILDDGVNGIPAALPYVDANSTVRLGSSTANLTGILGFGFSNYRVMPFSAAHPLGAPVFSYAARPLTPPTVGGAPNLRVVGFNVENFFNGDGAGGGFPTSRGAHSFAEYVRQRDKIVEALFVLNADIVGLVEIENDGAGPTSAIAQLVDALNTRFGTPGLYAFINDAAQPPFPTGDEIRSTIIYKTTVVTTVGLPMIDLAAVHNRAPTAQTFNLTSENKNFSVVVNHLRAKACSGSSTGANADQGDGQGCNNDFRRQQADAIISFINGTVIPTSGNNRVIAVGDYNAYYEEDPMDIFRANGFLVLSNNTEPSYSFQGQLGTLDHVMITSSLVSSVTGIAKWTINSHEPAYFDYNDNIQDAGEGASEVNPWFSLGTGIPFGTSDHDPVITGFLLSSTLPVEWGSFIVTKAGSAAKINWSTLQEINSKHFVIERSADARNWNAITTIPAAGNSAAEIKYSYTDASPLKGKSYYRIRQVDENGAAKTTDVRNISFSDFKTISFFPNPATDKINLQSGTATIISYRISDGEGRTLIQSNVNQLSTSVNVSKLGPGMYTLQVVTANGTSTEKFIKQ